ncbi:serine/threonine-protein kinase [Streptomyces sp. SID13726]|uniref:serine/threonine-protein kinase n=1 Tax=Streptomyces sp. SID13726 TaxID=2706058 RepID=UPI0013BCE02A|nr:serine/threonine-protein kinase [Streptomyces sp. SID13726]NEA98085.1 serine/threonine protein kinase [Streptomyces sp. SID13726]
MSSLDPEDPPAVGGYPLLARLGAGGMGQVYLSRTASGRPLALKTVRAELGADAGFEERFAREIASSDQVRSPWTAAVVDYSPAGHRPQWLATEYVPAPSLAEWVERHGPLSEPAVLALAAELAEGLRAVHRAGLAHRDVKPSNVLLARRHPLLIDFGIARAVDDTRHTRTGGVIGSPGFMAPEQASGGISAGPGDVFSLGAVLVHAATGQGPFLRPGEAPSAARLLYRIVHEEPVLDAVPPALVRLLADCLHKSPEARPTADGLLKRLTAASGTWAGALPAGLAEDIAAREAELGTLLERSHPVPVPELPTRSAGFGPPLGYPATEVPPAPGVFGPPVPPPPYASLPGAPMSPARAPGSRAGTALLVVGAVAVVAAVIALALPNGSDDDKNGTGGADGTRPSSPSPSLSAATDDALPASWTGTWKGTGPGSGSGDGVVNSRTTGVSVTVTLHAAAEGDIVGRQVSHITDDTGRDIGCTETLRLSEARGTSMVFEAATSTATDPSAGVLCVRGNVYTLTKTGTDTLTLNDEGGQAAGSPSQLTRTS